MRARALYVVLMLGALSAALFAALNATGVGDRAEAGTRAPSAAASFPAASFPGAGASGAPAAAAGAPGAPSVTAGRAGQAVLVGVPALRWSDVNPRDTPNLWRMVRRGSAASLSVRTIGSWTCATDGWLSVASAHKAKRHPVTCDLPAPPASGAATASGGAATVTEYPRWRQANLADTFQARIGLLGDAVHAAGGTTAAVGAGGAIAVADRNGRVDAYAATIDRLPAETWRGARLTAVDIDDIVRTYAESGVSNEQREQPASAGLRRTAVHRADERIGRVLAAAPSGATVLVAGLSDSSQNPHLRVALAAGPGYRQALLTSKATRRDGMVHISDMGTSALVAAGVAVPPEAVGKAVTPAGPAANASDAAARETVTRLAGTDRAAQTIRRIKGPFFIANVVIQLLLYIAAAVVLRRREGAERRRVLSATRVIAIAGAALPVAAFLANLVPWWRADAPVPALLGLYVLMDALVVTIALAGPWRRGIVVPGTIVAALTALLLAADVMTGSRLQLNSPTGYDALAGGRFYGFGNIAFAAFATSMLLAAAGLAHALLSRGRQLGAVLAVAGLGTVAILLDGLPSWGSDFGGVVALLPGVAVAALIISGRRVSIGKLALFGMGGVVVVTLMTYLDYARPPEERTHLGQFAHQLLQGGGVPVINRKLEGMLNTVGSPTLLPVILGALAFLVFILLRPGRYQTGGLRLAYEHFPALRAGLIGSLITALVGFGINDSGAAVPALALTIAIPLALAASVQAMRLAAMPVAAPAGAPADGGDPPEPAGAPEAAETPETTQAPEVPGSAARPAEPSDVSLKSD